MSSCNENTIFHKLKIGKLDLGILAFAFLISLLSKGGALTAAYSVDDYAHSAIRAEPYSGYFAQGRYAQAFSQWILSSINVSVTDVYLFFGFIALLFQSVLAVSTLRFLGLSKKSYSFILAGLLVSHPYTTEIFTFKIAIPAFAASLILSVITLESVLKFSESNKKAYLYAALMSTIAMTFTYQVFISTIFTISIVSAFIIYVKNSAQESDPISYKKSIALFLVAIFSSIIFVLTLKYVNHLLSITSTGRSKIIAFDQINYRIQQVLATLQSMYYNGEPIQAALEKRILLIIALFSTIYIFIKQFRKNNLRFFPALMLTNAAFGLAFAMLSIGVILPFKDWWPAPRVLTHFSIIPIAIIGVAFILFKSTKIRAAVFCTSLFLLILQALSSNQVFRDQQRMNSWDQMFANRVVARLEAMDNFSGSEYLYIHGQRYSYPSHIRTIQGDMNLSALATSWSNIRLFEETTGHKFLRPNAAHVEIGTQYCRKSKPWPHKEAVSIIDGLAIICISN